MGHAFRRGDRFSLPGEAVVGAQVEADVFGEEDVFDGGEGDEAGEGVAQAQVGAFAGGVGVHDAAAGFGVVADLGSQPGDFPIDFRSVGADVQLCKRSA